MHTAPVSADSVPASEVRALVFLRPSRHGGPTHQVRVDPATFRPLGCSCAAGQHGVVCWAVLDVVIEDLYWLAWDRMVVTGQQQTPASPAYHEARAAFERVNGWRYIAEAVQAQRGTRLLSLLLPPQRATA